MKYEGPHPPVSHECSSIQPRKNSHLFDENASKPRNSIQQKGALELRWPRKVLEDLNGTRSKWLSLLLQLQFNAKKNSVNLDGGPLEGLLIKPTNLLQRCQNGWPKETKKHRKQTRSKHIETLPRSCCSICQNQLPHQITKTVCINDTHMFQPPPQVCQQEAEGPRLGWAWKNVGPENWFSNE